jgi:hypothetical protein
MQSADDVGSRLGSLVVGVVAIAERELATRRRMIAYSPAALLMTVVLLDGLIGRRRDCAEQADLRDVGAEARPERLVGAGFIDGEQHAISRAASVPKLHVR